MRFTPDSDTGALLAAHDRLLRGESELVGADQVRTQDGLWLAVFGDAGFVTHHALGERSAAALDSLVSGVVAQFAASGVSRFEWKTRSHDAGNDQLTAALLRAGLLPEPVETVMIGEPSALLTDFVLPEPLVLRKAGTGGGDLVRDIADVDAVHRAVFEHHDHSLSQQLLNELTTHPDRLEMWLVSDGEQVISAGRLELAAPVAGLFGGATLPEWRGRGLYRALTAARARSAAQAGCDLVYAECTPFSEPILRRAGLRAVTTTTPYRWGEAEDS